MHLMLSLHKVQNGACTGGQISHRVFFTRIYSHAPEITQIKSRVSVSVFLLVDFSFLPSLWDSSVGVATLYGLDDPGIESRSGRDIPNRSRQALRSIPTSYTMGTRYFLWERRPRRDDHPPHLAPRLNEVYSYTFTPPLGLRGLF